MFLLRVWHPEEHHFQLEGRSSAHALWFACPQLFQGCWRSLYAPVGTVPFLLPVTLPQICPLGQKKGDGDPPGTLNPGMYTFRLMLFCRNG